MARAARLELRVLVMRERPDANRLGIQGFELGALGGVATLPLMKGQTGFVHVEV